MKAKFITAIISTSLLLTACGGGHGPKAVDKVEEAQNIALEKAPKAQEVKFEDEGQPTMGGVGGVNGTKPAPATTEETPQADNTATATAEPASTETKTDEVANPNTNTETPKTENAENADTKQQ